MVGLHGAEMVEVILPSRVPRATFASSFRANGREANRRTVPVSLLTSPRPHGEGHMQASGKAVEADPVGLSSAEVTAAAREQRRLEMERELCEKLGLQTPEASPVARPKLTAVAKAPSVRPTSAGPSRPPKPKPHRPLPEAPGSFHAPVSAEELPSVRRWKSSALSTETALASPGRNEGSELSKTAPAAVLGPDETSPAMSPRQEDQEGGIGEGFTQTSLRGTGLCAVNIKPSAPLSLEASPASGADVLLETDPQVEVEQVEQVPPGVSERVESPGPVISEMKGARLLEEGSRRLRENLQRLRLENRRHRVRPVVFSADVDASLELHADQPEKPRHFEELRRKIAALEEVSWAEEQRLRLEQKETQERREKQEAFERSLQEQLERQLQEHREREAREAEEQAAREEEARQLLEERQSRRKMQLEQEEQRSRQLEEQRLGRFGASSDVRGLTDELERQWAEQEAQERRRVEDYARFRRRQFEEWERHFAAERLRFASEAEFCAAKLRQKARVAAAADEQFYASKRDTWHKSERALPEAEGDTNLAPEERQVMKELRSVLGAPRETQKAKVKDLLIRLHPDKNPGCTEKAKQLFQFLQEQRRAVLGL